VYYTPFPRFLRDWTKGCAEDVQPLCFASVHTHRKGFFDEDQVLQSSGWDQVHSGNQMTICFKIRVAWNHMCRYMYSVFGRKALVTQPYTVIVNSYSLFSTVGLDTVGYKILSSLCRSFF